MQYILVHNNRVLNGPRDWRRRSFEDTLNEELNIQINLPPEYDSTTPIVINELTRIMACEQTYPNYNQKTEYIHGPFWNFDNDIAQGTYQVLPTSIELIKNTLKAQVASERYTTEVAGFKYTIQNTEVFVDTSRDTRNIFVQKLLLMADTDTCSWKFPEAWLTLTKTELASIVMDGAAFVQNCFNWEEAKVIEIDLCTTAEQLDAINLKCEVSWQS